MIVDWLLFKPAVIVPGMNTMLQTSTTPSMEILLDNRIDRWLHSDALLIVFNRATSRRNLCATRKVFLEYFISGCIYVLVASERVMYKKYHRLGFFFLFYLVSLSVYLTPFF